MPNVAILDSLLRTPPEHIKDLKVLSDLLTIKNTAYAQAKRRSKFTNEKENKIYFEVDQINRLVLLPRNIDSSLFVNGIYPEFRDDRSEGYSLGKHQCFIKLREYQNKFLYTPHKEEQLSVAQLLVRDLLTDLTYVVPCGQGKTILGLFTANLIGKSTIIHVTTHQLAKQWLDRIKEFFPTSSCGLYDDSNKKIYDFTLTTYDLMSDDKFGLAFYKQFGLSIFDEVHRIGADTYSTILSKSCTKYRLSLTATFRRKDGTDKILKHHCGKVFTMPRYGSPATVIPVGTGIYLDMKQYRTVEKRCTPFRQLGEYEILQWRDEQDNYNEVMLINKGQERGRWYFDVQLTQTQEKKRLVETEFKQNRLYRYGTISMAAIDTDVSELLERNDILFSLLEKCILAGRTIILLSKRKEQLYVLANMLKNSGLTERYGIIISKKDATYKKWVKENTEFTNLDDYENYVLKTCQVILGIDKIAKEGMDVEHADTIIYAHPERDIEQSVGRILRLFDGKRQPLALYPIDNIPPYNNYFYSRGGAKEMFLELNHNVFDEIPYAEFLKQY